MWWPSAPRGGLRDAESLLDQLSLLPPPIEATAVWDLLGAVPEQELLQLVQAMSSAEPVVLLEAARNLLDRGRDPGAVLQGLAGILRDLVLMAAAPDRPELTGVSPQFRDQLPPLAKALGRARLLQWQAQLRGSEQQLRQSVQPRLWLEVLLLGLLAEATTTTQATTASAPDPACPVSPPAGVLRECLCASVKEIANSMASRTEGSSFSSSSSSSCCSHSSLSSPSPPPFSSLAKAIEPPFPE